MQWINTRSELSGLELAFTHLAVIYMRPSKENKFKVRNASTKPSLKQSLSNESFYFTRWAKSRIGHFNEESLLRFTANNL